MKFTTVGLDRKKVEAWCTSKKKETLLIGEIGREKDRSKICNWKKRRKSEWLTPSGQPQARKGKERGGPPGGRSDEELQMARRRRVKPPCCFLLLG